MAQRRGGGERAPTMNKSRRFKVKSAVGVNHDNFFFVYQLSPLYLNFDFVRSLFQQYNV